MMNDIVLVQPRSGAWERLGTRPPDSLLAIAAAPVQEGYNVRILDTRLEKGWRKKLKTYLKRNPICIGLTSMTGVQIKHALEISRFVKENSEVPVVWGGVHPSLLPRQTVVNKYIDIVIVGEGDYTFLEVVRALEKNRSIGGIKGVCFKKGNIAKTTGMRPQIPDLDRLPDTPYHLVKVNKYYAMEVDGKPSFTLSTSRGCPFRCAFCYNTVYNKNRWRAKSAAKAFEEIKYLVEKYGIRNIYFHDDNFCVDLKRVDQLTKLLIKERIDINWGLLGTRIDSLARMEDRFLNQLIKAGCIDIDVGVESGSDRLLKLIRKDITVKQVLLMNKKLARYSFLTKYTFIGGFPTETQQELNQSIYLACRLGKENRRAYTPFFVYTLYPGTELYSVALQLGFKNPKRLEGWIPFNYEDACHAYPLLTSARIRTLKSLQFVSNFANRNIKYKISKKFVRLLFDLYHPIAKYRFENNFHAVPVERIAAKAFDGVF